MRFAVVSDIHANLPALEAVVDAAGPVDGIWQLGDVVGYGPEPDAVVQRLRDLGVVVFSVLLPALIIGTVVMQVLGMRAEKTGKSSDRKSVV